MQKTPRCGVGRMLAMTLALVAGASLSSPEASAQVTFVSPVTKISQRNPAFTWKRVADAGAYVIQVLDTRGPTVFAQGVNAANVCNATTNICTVNGGLNLADGIYQWKMYWVAKRGGAKSAYTPFTRFTVEGTDTPLHSTVGHALGTWPAGANYRSFVFTPPAPLANLRVYNVAATGTQSVTGDGSTDLLLVGPPQVIDGQFQIAASGFRGIYFIGASFDPSPRGTMKSPTGMNVPAYPSLVRLQTSATPVSRPFIYVAKMRLKNTKTKCCDFLQVGGKAKVGNWGAWPDVYRYKMLVNGNFGWTQQLGGTWGGDTNHSDFMVPAMGGVRHIFSGDVDVTWGYQAEFLAPSFSTNFKIYDGPDGYGENHFWNQVTRMQVNAQIGSTNSPSSFFFARGSTGVQAGEYHSFYFHGGSGQGNGVYVVPAPGQAMVDTTNPRNGVFGPFDYGTYLTWPTIGYKAGHAPIASGKLFDGSKVTPPVVVTESEVGFAQRVTSAAALAAYTAQMKSAPSS